MKRLFFTTSISLFLCLMPLSAGDSPSDDFGTTITDFRYSLYHDLAGIPAGRLFKEKNPASAKIARKCEKFFKKHRKEIRAHQDLLLRRFQKTVIDLSGAKKDIRYSSFDPVMRVSPWGWQHSPSAPREYRKSEREINILKIALLDPLHHASYLVNLYLARNLTPGEMGQRVFRNSIAAVRIRTEKIDKSTWKIIIDEYRNVFVFHFDLEKNIMKISEIYFRGK